MATFLALVSAEVAAWSNEGLRVIVRLAQAQLTAKAKAEIDKLLALEPGETTLYPLPALLVVRPLHPCQSAGRQHDQTGASRPRNRARPNQQRHPTQAKHRQL